MNSNRRDLGARALTVLTIILILGAAPASAESNGPLRSGEDGLLPTAHGPRPLVPAEQVVAAGDPRLDYDVIHYDLDLEPRFETDELSGTTRIELRTLVPTEEIVLDLADRMSVQEAWIDSADAAFAVEFQHEDDKIRLALPRVYDIDEMVEVGISYEGAPGSSVGFGHSFFGDHDSGPIAASLSEPASAHTWWVCKDLWTDKATVTVRILTPPGFTAVSNGNFTQQVMGMGGESYVVWVSSYPIATYLVAIAVTNYVTWEATYVGEDGAQIPLVFYAYPEHEERARESWTEPTLESMEIFEDLFGPYPFSRQSVEKYGTAEFHWLTGAEEHQTLTSYGSALVDSLHTFDWVVAHELSHQWFGDAVTPDAFHETWTKEGVATYCEALYMEQRELLRGNGPEAARDALLQHMERRRWPESIDRDIMGNPQNPYSTASVYARGAWVLHMLRRILGDDDFYLTLRNFMNEHLYGNAGTEELVETAEEVYLGDLTWFFEPWVYSNARPHISYEWTSARLGDRLWEVRLYAEQTQEADPFRLPVDVRTSGDSEFSDYVVWLEGRWESFVLETDFEPQTVELDPNRWLLADIVPMSVTASAVVLRAPAPNPISSGGDIDISVSYRIPSPGDATLDLVDVSGRRVGTLVSGHMPEGWQLFKWDGLMDGSRLASGIYWLRLHHSGMTASEKVVVLQ